MANYIGKIAAVVTANVSDVAPKLSASAREWNKYGKSVQASIDAARRNARSSFDQIFTAQQRLERAFASSRNTTLKIDTREGEDAIRRLIAASQELARPLVSAQKQFSSLSSSIQNEFGRALSEAQNAARSAAAAINETGRLGEQSFERYKRRVDEAVVSIRRLSEANAAVGGLATGRELRFQQAGFAAELQRTSALQSQASALPADARASGAVAQLVELQRREADEAARLLAVLENVRNTRRGDAAAAQANLDAQTQRLAQVNLQLERQVALYNEVEQRQRQTAAAASQVAARESATELNRRDGTLARRNAAAFVESTAGLVSDPEIARRQKELERANALRATFSALPAEAQASLERQRQQFENIAISAEKGAVSVGILADANDRLAVAVEGAREASADQQRRREVATALLPPVVEVPSQEQQRSDLFGRPVDDAARRLGVLQGAINSVKGAVDQLPIPLQTRFVPLLAQAEANLIALKNSGTATAAAIKIAADEVSGLKSEVDASARAFSAFGGTFAEFADAATIRSAQARLQALRQVLLGATGDTERAVEAADDLAAAFNRAASTPGGFNEFSTQLNQLEREAVEAAAAVLNISPEQLAERLKRAGDVSRNGLGSVQLAVQQAAFAFDDFFSVTGDLSQRIRAAGNNISQLGFILGGIVPGLTATQGLIAGIAVSVGAQLVASIVKWTNAGRTAEDQTKSLNDALARQKSLVEELAQAFDTLGDTIARRTFSGPAQEARAFAKELDEVRRRQKELRDQRSFSLDEGVLQARADVSVAERQLSQSTTRDQAVAAQRRLAEARARLDQEEARVRSQPAIDIVATTRLIGEVFDEAARRAATRAAGLAGGAGGGTAAATASSVAFEQVDERRVSLQDRLSREAGGSRAEDLIARARILREEQAAASQRGDDRLVAQLEELINRIRTQASSTTADEFAVSLLKSANAASVEIEQAQARVAEAIGAGSASAFELRAALDALGAEIDAATAEIANAQADFAESGRTDDDASRRDARVRAVQPQIDAAQELSRGFADRSRDTAIESLARPDRAGAALRTLQSSEAFANEYAGLTARLQSAVEREKFAREQLSASNNEATRAQLKTAQAATQLATAAAEAAIAINSGFDRFRASIQSLAQETQRAADEAQRRVNQAEGVGGPSVGQLERDRDRIEENLEIDQRFVRNIESQLQAALAGLSNDPEFQRQSDRLNQLRNEAEAAAARAIQTNVPEDPRVTVDRANQIARAEQALDEIRKRSQEGIQKQAEAELRLRAARDRQEEFLRADRDRRQPTGDAVRGLDALGGARQRARDEVSQRRADIEAARQARGNDIRDRIALGQGEDVNVARQQLEAAQRRLEQERFRQRQFANLLEPVNQAENDAIEALSQAERAQSAAQVFSGIVPDFGTDLPRGTGNIEEAQQAIEKARELLQQVSLLGSNAKPEDFAELAKIFPRTLSEFFSERDLNNLQAASFVGAGVKGATQDDAREAARRQIANAQRELNAFVNAGRPTVEAASAEVARQGELSREASAGLEEVLKGAGLDRVDFLRGRQDDLFAQRLDDAARSVEFAQAAFDQVNQPFADLEKNEREAAQARLRAIQDITDLGLSDQQKFANGLQDSLGEVQAQAEEFLGADDRRAALESLTNAQNNLARQNAPLFAQFSDEVANAVLQGPSRAALQVSDASTAEGQRELNRLLRGDDSARDVNLVELQKQSTYLQSIDTGISTLKERLGIAQ